MLLCSKGVPCRPRIRNRISPSTRSVFPDAKSSTAAPCVLTHAACAMLRSDPMLFTSSTSMSLRNVMSMILNPQSCSSPLELTPDDDHRGVLPCDDVPP